MDGTAVPFDHLTPAHTGRPAPRPRRQVLAAFGLAVSVAAWGVAPALAGHPSAATTPTRTSTPTAVTRSVDLYRAGANVLQYTPYWCVPAVTQTMLNIITGRSDRTYATQSRLNTELQRANLYDYAANGNDVRGWSRVLTARLPAGMGYNDRSFDSRSSAYEALVDAMERTRRPAGIVVAAGTHAWTVVGFTVRETPGVPGSRTILGLTVVGPLGSPRDPWPKRYYTLAQLDAYFTRYNDAHRKVVWQGKYVIVAPIVTVGSVTTSR